MVGPPRTLHDLRRIEANLVVTCRACGRAKEFDLETLIADLLRRRRSLEWHLLPGHFRCGAPGCGSKDIRLSAPAFPNRLRLESLPEIRAFLDATDLLIARLLDVHMQAEARDAVAQARTDYEAAKRALIGWGWRRGRGG
jgi:hypothetical protein